MTRLGVLVSGNGSNLQALIDATATGVIPGQIAVVISNVPGVRALQRAEAAGIAAIALSHKQYASRRQFDAAVVEELRRYDVEWVVFAGFMRLVTPVLIDAFENRIINIHPSLLPAFPGVDAGRQALEYGVKVTGCTVHLVTQDMDSGPIIAQTPVVVEDDDTVDSLMQRMHAAEHETLVRVVQGVCEGRLAVERANARPKVSMRKR